jgi:hypothetical protein
MRAVLPLLFGRGDRYVITVGDKRLYVSATPNAPRR